MRPLPAKALVEEVDEYDFFVLYKKDEAGVYNAQGYWTKNRKREWSLNTLVIFPHCQKNGFGGLMIGLSYLILKVCQGYHYSLVLRSCPFTRYSRRSVSKHILRLHAV